MEGTRVFVSGLPPKLTSEELRKHFSRFHVTDAHIIPHRRIGFVGFKDAGIAKQAVDYFNKTYIRMSKISVDIARPVSARLLDRLHLFLDVLEADDRGSRELTCS